MNIYHISGALLFSLWPFLSIGQNPPGFETMVNALLNGKVDTISTRQLHEKIEHEEVFVLDSRESKEYLVSHIRGARYVGYDDFQISRVVDIQHDSPIVVYCSVGKRSEDIAMKLKAAGYSNVLNHWGGIFDWTNQGYEVVNVHNEPVEIVHPYSRTWGIWVNRYEKVYEPR
jgi:rhodanese-related sulfurtransferase